MVTLNKSPLEALYAGRSPHEAGRLFERLVRKILKELHPIWEVKMKKPKAVPPQVKGEPTPSA
jgi:hypothetical protein